LNALRGTRMKVFLEAYKFFDNTDDYMTVMGFDWRNYIQIHKTFIWANRVAGSSSMGARKTLFMLGGVENWMLPKMDNSLAPPAGENFAYQGLGTNMRGFLQN